MSGFLPAFVATRERQSRARVVAFLLGLSHAGAAWGQVPLFAPAEQAAAERRADPAAEAPAAAASPAVAPVVDPPTVESIGVAAAPDASLPVDADAPLGADAPSTNAGSRAVPV